MKPHFEIVDETYNSFIQDTANHLNFAHLCEGGHGLRSSARKVAERVVEFLNNLPEEQTNLL